MKCLICEQDIEVIYEGNLKKGEYPCIVGGTIIIDFGYGSQFDKILEGYDELHAYICDNCYKAKQSLVKKMQISRSISWNEIPPSI